LPKFSRYDKIISKGNKKMDYKQYIAERLNVAGVSAEEIYTAIEEEYFGAK